MSRNRRDVELAGRARRATGEDRPENRAYRAARWLVLHAIPKEQWKRAEEALLAAAFGRTVTRSERDGYQAGPNNRHYRWIDARDVYAYIATAAERKAGRKLDAGTAPAPAASLELLLASGLVSQEERAATDIQPDSWQELAEILETINDFRVRR